MEVTAFGGLWSQIILHRGAEKPKNIKLFRSFLHWNSKKYPYHTFLHWQQKKNRQSTAASGIPSNEVLKLLEWNQDCMLRKQHYEM